MSVEEFIMSQRRVVALLDSVPYCHYIRVYGATYKVLYLEMLLYLEPVVMDFHRGMQLAAACPYT